MSQVEPIKTSTSHRKARSRSHSARSEASGQAPHLSRVFSAQHFDDHSHYHGGEERHGQQLEPTLTECSCISEKVEQEDQLEFGGNTGDEYTEFREGVVNEQDVEAPLEKTKSFRSIKDPNLVTWDGAEDPDNPKNWTQRRRWAATLVVSSFTFISPVSSSMVAPAISSIASDFNITNEVEQQLVLSVFVLAYAIGPLFLGPLSEIYGRVPVLQLANLFFLVFNTACGGSKTKGEMIAFRFLSGLGGSAPLAIGGGVLSDCWKAEERGRAISLYSLAPLLGPAIGPIAGAFVTENTTWRWAFYVVSIADALIQLSGLFFLKETYPPKLLHIKANKLRKETGNHDLHTEFEHPERGLANTLRRALIRPLRLLGTQVIVQALALYMAYIYGLMYLVLSTFPVLWTEHYDESIGIGGLNYISLALGFFLGSQICAPLNDKIYCRLKERNGGVGRSEFRTPLMVPGSILVPCGLFLYGWSAQYHTHWIVPNIGAVIFASGVIIGFQCIQTYIVDAYTKFAASAIGAATVLRSLAGFGFPLLAPKLYHALDYGWGNSLLGFIAIGIGLPAPVLLWLFGQKLRQSSPFAAG